MGESEIRGKHSETQPSITPTTGLNGKLGGLLGACWKFHIDDRMFCVDKPCGSGLQVEERCWHVSVLLGLEVLLLEQLIVLVFTSAAAPHHR